MKLLFHLKKNYFSFYFILENTFPTLTPIVTKYCNLSLVYITPKIKINKTGRLGDIEPLKTLHHINNIKY